MEIRIVDGPKDGIFAIRLGGRNAAELYLLSRSGFGRSHGMQRSYILMVDVLNRKVLYDHSRWSRGWGGWYLKDHDRWDEFRIIPDTWVKTVELLDSGTFLPCIVIRLEDIMDQAHQHVIIGLTSMEVIVSGDPLPNRRHFYILMEQLRSHWDDISVGQVVDVQYILGETKELKRSEGWVEDV